MAVKVVSKAKLKDHNGLVGQLFQNELFVLENCKKNPNVVAMLRHMESSNNQYIVMEFCEGGDLDQLLKIKKTLPEILTIEFLK